MSKLRVWWIPQVPMQSFYVPVTSVEEGKKVMDMLAAYDAFQLQNKVKPDYCNTGGLQMYDEENKEWIDWYMETDYDYFDNDNIDEYLLSIGKEKEMVYFTHELFLQIDWDKINAMTQW